MLLQPGHIEGERTVHMTHTSLVAESLCGEQVSLDGEPDLATVCADCLELARAAGADVSAWARVEEVTHDLQLAA